MANIHPAAAVGYAAQAATYVSGRPDYPPEVENWLRGDLGLGTGKRTLDLGAGTGKFLPRLLATGAEVVAVEPVAEMRAQLSALHPGVEVKPGSAQDIPLPDRAVDAVVCAQSFHWFAEPEALAEIRRVLKPGGVLGLIWNVRDASVPWVAALRDIMAPFGGDAPRFHSGEWRKPFPAGRSSNSNFRTFIRDLPITLSSTASSPSASSRRCRWRSATASPANYGRLSQPRRNSPERAKLACHTRLWPIAAERLHEPKTAGRRTGRRAGGCVVEGNTERGPG